ncbi:cordon-bleu-like [Homarus americanus]|uniref:Cordon-bleu-like n=1 Tax=Homarus americanus TaxID=6706 RepID=A0A8J5JT12_HOMAM|nr:cordon-bleu-like [Homarus americanus]
MFKVSWADRIMAPPPLRHFASTSAMSSRHVTEDTPADLLEGTMDLTVILPIGHRVTTAHKINPGGHVINVVSDNRLLSYKPSTPIGTLDTSVIQIVAKNKVNEEARKRRAHLVTQAIERNIRLKVNLPHNQLTVLRVPTKTLISDVLSMVCKEKSIDPDTHEIRHPVFNVRDNFEKTRLDTKKSIIIYSCTNRRIMWKERIKLKQKMK